MAPLYRIGPRSDGGGRTGAKSGEVFLGWMRGGTADKKRSKNFVLGLPYSSTTLKFNQCLFFHFTNYSNTSSAISLPHIYILPHPNPRYNSVISLIKDIVMKPKPHSYLSNQLCVYKPLHSLCSESSTPVTH